MEIKRIPFSKYSVTDEGEVLSHVGGKTKLMKSRPDKDGYQLVFLTVNGKRGNKKIHRLVAEAFIDNPLNLSEINHKDGDKSNNRVANLEWVTAQANMIHARNIGLRPNVCKINMSIANRIREVYATGLWTQEALGNVYGISDTSVSLIVNNKAWVNGVIAIQPSKEVEVDKDAA